MRARSCAPRFRRAAAVQPALARGFHTSPDFLKVQSRFAAVAQPDDEVSKMSKMQQNIAAHMSYTWSAAPHVSTVTQIDMSAVTARREELRDEYAERGEGKLTFTHLTAYAAVQALKEHPNFNVSIVDKNKILSHKHINLSFAVATDDGGLLVPCVKRAEDMSLGEMAARMNQLATAARTRKIPVDELRGGGCGDDAGSSGIRQELSP
eukprot:TRINITY_DN8064_c0_g2_i3.p1 TRINITY_DN8064_c0_g2~~TRINITY_DN8064_c0_g2_i3.p1  ORF type:complete len:208 (+),score=56.55 TRINITY_DN8064_c0_g2_i3:235-858(+)